MADDQAIDPEIANLVERIVADTSPALIDHQIQRLIAAEKTRQSTYLRLIPSENYASRQVQEATGSILMNKYSEGYPGRRYYQGLAVIDAIERLTIQRAKDLFQADHANVQPYSGSIAVLACYFAVCEPGDRVLGPLLAHGGHLSHGHSVNITGKLFNVAQYGVSEKTETFDYEEIRQRAIEHKPKMIIIGGTAFPRQLDFVKFRSIADEVEAVLMGDLSHNIGLIAGSAYPKPFPYCDIVAATTHKTLRGPRAAIILCKSKHQNAVDKAVFPLLQGGPHQHTQAGIAVALHEAALPKYREYVANVVANTKRLAETLSAGELRLVSGGTDTHLILADATSLGWNSGKAAAIALEEAGIVVNANALPFDKGSALRPSGIRLGMPAATTLGMGIDEATRIGQLILQVLRSPADWQRHAKEVRCEVRGLMTAFPVPEYFISG